MAHTRAQAFVITAVLQVTLSGVAASQDRLFHYGYELGAIGRFGERIGPARGLDGDLVGGGRFLVGDTEVTDLRSGARRPLPAGAVVTALDPARPYVVVTVPEPVTGTALVGRFDIVTGVLEPLVSTACRFGSPFGPEPAVAAYAYDAQRLVVGRCNSGQMVSDYVAVDVGHPRRPTRVLPIPTSAPLPGLVLSSDGTRLYVKSLDAFLTNRTEAYDVGTGTQLGTTTSAGSDLRWDEAFDGLLSSSGGAFTPSLVQLYGRSLEPLGAASFFSNHCPVTVQASAHTGRIYVTRNGTASTGAEPVVVEAYAGQPLRLVASGLPTPGPTLSCQGAVLRTAPGAPRGLAATVVGSTVTFDWANVGAASTFILEAGSAPGRTEASLWLGPDSEFTIGGVPPGAYYVRVRGANEFGGGRASPDILVVVP